MVQSPSWEANWFAVSQEIPRISRNPKVHYRTHKRPPPFSILSQPNPVHIPTSHLLEIHPNIIHPSMPRSPQWSPSLRFPQQDPIHPLSSLIRATCPAHLILLHFITRTILGEQYKSFSSSLCILLHSPVTSSLLSPNILLNTTTFALRDHTQIQARRLIMCLDHEVDGSPAADTPSPPPTPTTPQSRTAIWNSMNNWSLSLGNLGHFVPRL